MSLLLASFYTPTWEYPANARRLAGECGALGIDYHIEERPDQGAYFANCRQKPVYLLELMRKYNRPLLWMDVDGSVYRKPVMPMEVDFAARPMAKYRKRQWHVGTLFFNATPGALALLERWVEYLDPTSSDEEALDRLWRSRQWPATFAELSAPYFQVQNRTACPRGSTIIMHRLSKSPAKRFAK